MSSVHPKNASRRAFGKVLTEAIGLARTPQRAFSLVQKLISDRFRTTLEHRHLYSYIKAKRDSDEILDSVIRWILNAQRPDGGIAAYYSLLTGFSEAYPEVTGYVVPTLYDYDEVRKNSSAVAVAERATNWLLSLQLPTGAFPGGLYGSTAHPSVFNTGQILQGLVRAHIETRGPEIKRAAIAAGDWLVQLQQRDGSWSGRGAYQDTAHTYYTMVAWALVDLSERTSDRQYAVAANKNLDWTLDHFRPNGWIDGIHLHGHPNYLHFIAYILQGTLETSIRLRRTDAIERVAKSAWALLRKFETNKFLPGAYDADFKKAHNFACLTGNAQMACVWFRLYEVSSDLRYFNAALKMNEMLKPFIPSQGACGIIGGVAGSYPIWGRYQPLRYISWGCKFFADSLLLERRLKRRVTNQLEVARPKALPCAS